MACRGQSQVSSNSSRSANSNRTDPGWKYCHQLAENDTNNCVCNFCGKVTKGGITRAKEHLMGKKGNVAACSKCPKEVREELWGYLKDKRKRESEAIAEIQSQKAQMRDILDLDGDSDEGRAMDEEFGFRDIAPAPASASRRGTSKGPIDLFFGKPENAIEKNRREKLRQVSIKEACDKQATARVHQYIARFWYQAGLSFNMIKLQSFHDMVAAIGSFGPHLRVPSYHDIRVPLLNKELEYTQELLKHQKQQWASFGCSIMSDAWTDRKQRCLINFLVNSPAGTMFIKSIDGSNFVKTGEKLFELLDSIVEEIGEEKVVQVITDNGSNYVLAGKLLEEKRPHLYWTPCAAHCIDLILEDIGKLPLIKKTIQRGISLVGFIYSHSSTLSLLRYFTNKRELVRHAVTRFATSFLSLERIHKEKANLRRMFTSNDWASNKLSKEAKGREATKTILMPAFWNNVVFILKVMAPLVRVLRLVDSEKKPAMGYIYEAMEKAKEVIIKSFKNNESKYKEVFEIIDKRWTCQLHRPLHAAGHFLNPELFYDNPDMEYDFEVTNGLYACIEKLVKTQEVKQKILLELPIYKAASGMFGNNFAILQRKAIAPAQWWRMYGQSAPNLQKLAIKILSLTCSASGCERNWSVFEQIHSKKRNRLEHKRLHDLVYVKYNQALNRRYNLRDEIDPISLDHIDECNEWLLGEMDGDADDDDAANERVFEDDDGLNWETVYRASGIGEPRTYTRRQTKKRKEPASGSSTTAARVSKTKKGSTSASSTKRGKEKVVEVEDDEELEFEDHIEELEEELQEIDFEDSEGEEPDGYASLSDTNNDDYVDVEEPEEEEEEGDK